MKMKKNTLITLGSLLVVAPLWASQGASEEPKQGLEHHARKILDQARGDAIEAYKKALEFSDPEKLKAYIEKLKKEEIALAQEKKEAIQTIIAKNKKKFLPKWFFRSG